MQENGQAKTFNNNKEKTNKEKKYLMGYSLSHAPIYGYLKGYQHTIPLHLVHYARTFSIFKLLNKIQFSSLLNVGGGNGYHCFLIEKIFNIRGVNLDINHNLLRSIPNFKSESCCGDAKDLPFGDSSFDISLCIETIEHINNPQKVINELIRVSKYGVILSTESFFESEKQKNAFLQYIRETHPELFRENDPVAVSDVNHFTLNDFQKMFGTKNFKFFPQFRNKHAEILAPINQVRDHVRKMTEGIEVNRASRIILLFEKKSIPQRTIPFDD